MKLALRVFVAGATLAVLLAASTRFVSTWKNPLAKPLDVGSAKVAAFVVTSDQVFRLGREETLATELRKRGLNCVAGYTVLPGELAKDKEKAKEFLNTNGITNAVLMRLVGQEERTEYIPGTMWYYSPYYTSFWGYWDYGWASVYSPGYLVSDTVVSIETLFYSIEENSLLWAGRSETTNPDDIREFAEDLVDAAGKEMRKAGLVRD